MFAPIGQPACFTLNGPHLPEKIQTAELSKEKAEQTRFLSFCAKFTSNPTIIIIIIFIFLKTDDRLNNGPDKYLNQGSRKIQSKPLNQTLRLSVSRQHVWASTFQQHLSDFHSPPLTGCVSAARSGCSGSQ